VDYSKFQVAVVEIASEGTRLTTANVVSRLRIDPAKAERMLDQMARDGRLDLEVDETEGVVVYHVRGLTPAPRAADGELRSRLEALRRSVEGSTEWAHVGTALAFGKPFRNEGRPLPPSLRRSVPAGVVWGGLFPGLGLAYAAPWTAVAIATAIVVVGFKVLPFLLAIPFLLCATVLSAVLGGIYTWRYNQTGRRSPLRPFDEPARLPRSRAA